MLRLRFKIPTRKRALLEGVVVFVLIAGATTIASLYVPLLVGVVVASVIAAPLLIVRLLRAGPVALVGPVLGVVAASIGCFFVAPPAKTLRGERAPNIRVNDAASHPRATIFGFTDGALRLDLHGTYEYEAGDSQRTVHVVPIVPEGWSPKQPVPLWACSRSENGGGEWSKPHRQGYRMREEDEEPCRHAITAVLERATLTTVADAPIVVWSPDPERESREALIHGLLFLLIPLLVLVVGLPLAYPQLAKRKGF